MKQASKWKYARVLFCFFLCINAHAQQKVYLYGYVEAADSQERLTGVSVFVQNQKTGGQTNAYGFFSVAVVANAPFKLTIGSVGFKTQQMTLSIKKDTLINVRLNSTTQMLDEVTITDNVQPAAQTLGSYHRLSVKSIERIPALLGERDVLKAIQLMPGVSGGKEGTVGLNVRGGSPDQNLFLLDGVPVYNINHLFGFLSVFNTDAVANVDFYKGGIPARYGGRLSSVVDVSLREGNNQKYQSKISLSPVASRLLFEGPIVKGRSSFLLSVRRSWLDFLTTPIAVISQSESRSVFKFYDINFKANYLLSARDKLFVSYYNGRDGLRNSFQLGASSVNFNYNWGNNTFVVRWNHLYSQRVFGNLSLSHTNFNYVLQNEQTDVNNFKSRFQSGIRDWALKYDWDIFLADNHNIKTGIALTAHRFSPEVQQIRTGRTDTLYAPQAVVLATELSVYGEDQLNITNKLSANLGIHLGFYRVENKTYANPQPRLSFKYQLNDHASVKLSAGRAAQYLHLLSNSSLGLPTDLWTSSTQKIAPQLSNQFSLGYYRSLKNNEWNFMAEGFYRTMTNVIEYQEGASFLNNASVNWEDKVAVGVGKAYGLEVMLQKNKGKLTGSLSYTLSRSERTFTDINQGRTFPYRYDAPHNVALNIQYELRTNKAFSVSFFFNSGAPLQIEQAKYAGSFPHNYWDPFALSPNPKYQSYYFRQLSLLSDRNTYRTPAYHRLDINYRVVNPKKTGNRVWTFGVYNVYNRNNPFFIFYDQSQLKQFSLFPIIPSFTYERNF